MPARPLALPNLLTYARIAAVPLVVALLYWQSIEGGALWLRWLALAVFIAAGVTDFFATKAAFLGDLDVVLEDAAFFGVADELRRFVAIDLRYAGQISAARRVARRPTT